MALTSAMFSEYGSASVSVRRCLQMSRLGILVICTCAGALIAGFSLLRVRNKLAVLIGFSLLAVTFAAVWLIRLAPWHSGGRRRVAELFIAVGVLLLWRAFGGKIR